MHHASILTPNQRTSDRYLTLVAATGKWVDAHGRLQPAALQGKTVPPLQKNAANSVWQALQKPITCTDRYDQPLNISVCTQFVLSKLQQAVEQRHLSAPPCCLSASAAILLPGVAYALYSIQALGCPLLTFLTHAKALKALQIAPHDLDIRRYVTFAEGLTVPQKKNQCEYLNADFPTVLAQNSVTPYTIFERGFRKKAAVTDQENCFVIRTYGDKTYSVEVLTGTFALTGFFDHECFELPLDELLQATEDNLPAIQPASDCLGGYAAIFYRAFKKLFCSHQKFNSRAWGPLISYLTRTWTCGQANLRTAICKALMQALPAANVTENTLSPLITEVCTQYERMLNSHHLNCSVAEQIALAWNSAITLQPVIDAKDALLLWHKLTARVHDEGPPLEDIPTALADPARGLLWVLSELIRTEKITLQNADAFLILVGSAAVASKTGKHAARYGNSQQKIGYLMTEDSEKLALQINIKEYSPTGERLSNYAILLPWEPAWAWQQLSEYLQHPKSPLKQLLAHCFPTEMSYAAAFRFSLIWSDKAAIAPLPKLALSFFLGAWAARPATFDLTTAQRVVLCLEYLTAQAFRSKLAKKLQKVLQNCTQTMLKDDSLWLVEEIWLGLLRAAVHQRDLSSALLIHQHIGITMPHLLTEYSALFSELVQQITQNPAPTKCDLFSAVEIMSAIACSDLTLWQRLIQAALACEDCVLHSFCWHTFLTVLDPYLITQGLITERRALWQRFALCLTNKPSNLVPTLNPLLSLLQQHATLFTLLASAQEECLHIVGDCIKAAHTVLLTYENNRDCLPWIEVCEKLRLLLMTPESVSQQALLATVHIFIFRARLRFTNGEYYIANCELIKSCLDQWQCLVPASQPTDAASNNADVLIKQTYYDMIETTCSQWMEKEYYKDLSTHTIILEIIKEATSQQLVSKYICSNLYILAIFCSSEDTLRILRNLLTAWVSNNAIAAANSVTHANHAYLEIKGVLKEICNRLAIEAPKQTLVWREILLQPLAEYLAAARYLTDDNLHAIRLYYYQTLAERYSTDPSLEQAEKLFNYIIAHKSLFFCHPKMPKIIIQRAIDALLDIPKNYGAKDVFQKLCLYLKKPPPPDAYDQQIESSIYSATKALQQLQRGNKRSVNVFLNNPATTELSDTAIRIAFCKTALKIAPDAFSAEDRAALLVVTGELIALLLEVEDAVQEERYQLLREYTLTPLAHCDGYQSYLEHYQRLQNLYRSAAKKRFLYSYDLQQPLGRHKMGEAFVWFGIQPLPKSHENAFYEILKPKKNTLFVIARTYSQYPKCTYLAHHALQLLRHMHFLFDDDTKDYLALVHEIEQRMCCLQ